MNNTFVGEHLLPGQLGHFFVILAFTASIVSFISYIFASQETADPSWKKIARIGFYINGLSVVGIGCSLFYIIFNHYFEYHYAWAHSSKSLPVYYMISCYWESQEGSFWLWTFWQSLIGFILIKKAKNWEMPVMSFIGLSQIFLSSMLLGVEILGQKIGSSPFILLRNAMNAPIFSRSDYLSLVNDGNGLNPLLQNYWMVIHPPTLFLGFAAMVVPSAYCFAGLWKQQWTEWIKPALPWALFALLVLGAGIIMGSFWAYEALNFGGFWAWDPVENASLFPWVILLAALHVMIVFQKTGQGYVSVVILTLISFVLVLYATFLTRSGILGEASVHSFTDLGLSGQLLIYLLLFLALSIFIIIKRWSGLPISQKDEEVFSREFWLYIGSLIMVVSCLQILGTTSLPVINKVLGTNLAPPIDAIKHYNKWQMPFAIIVILLSGWVLQLKFKKTDSKSVLASSIVFLIVSVLLTIPIVWITKTYDNFIYILLVFACVFSLISNGKILNTAFIGKKKISGAAISHIGFTMLILGALIAASTNKVISINQSGIGFGAEFEKNNNSNENILLYKNQPTQMGPYTLTYLGDSTNRPNIFYKILFQKIDPKSNNIRESFTLHPNAQINPRMGLVSSPDTRHYLLNDIYVHVSMVPQKNEDEHEHNEDNDEKYLPVQKHEVSPGDTIHLKDKYIVVRGIDKNPQIENLPLQPKDFAVGLNISVFHQGNETKTEPLFLIRGNNTFDFGKTLENLGLKLNFTNILPDKNKLELSVREIKPTERDYVVLKAIEFPYINLLWSGTIVMCAGFVIAIYNRLKKAS